MHTHYTINANPYRQASFIKSAAKINQLPPDEGIEVAFVGRSNAGKSSALNCLTEQKNLAKTSKTPGCTQLINLFELDPHRRLIDLPGYGFAKVSQKIKAGWQDTMSLYLESRLCLRGIILLSDCRHPLKPLDEKMLHVAIDRGIAVHVVLTKTDKISKSQVLTTLSGVKKRLNLPSTLISVQGFSANHKMGLTELIATLNQWFEFSATE